MQSPAVRHTHGMHPIDEPVSPEDAETLNRTGLTAALLRQFPVDGPFTLAEAKELAQYDVPALLELLRTAPVDGPFAPEQALEAARRGSYPADAHDDDGPIDVQEFLRRLR